MSEETDDKLAYQRGWTEPYAAAWTHLYLKSKRPPSDYAVKKLIPKMLKMSTIKETGFTK